MQRRSAKTRACCISKGDENRDFCDEIYQENQNFWLAVMPVQNSETRHYYFIELRVFFSAGGLKLTLRN